MPPAGSKVKHCQCAFASESPIERILPKIPKNGSTEADHWPHDYKVVDANPTGYHDNIFMKRKTPTVRLAYRGINPYDQILISYKLYWY